MCGYISKVNLYKFVFFFVGFSATGLNNAFLMIDFKKMPSMDNRVGCRGD